MPNVTTVENINVLQVGKYGVRVDDKTWYGVNEPLTPTHFAPNQQYKVSISISKTGKKYIKEVLGVSETAQVPVAAPAPTSVEPPKVSTPVDTERAERVTGAMREVDTSKSSKLDLKTIQIQRQGCWQAAIQSPALTTWAVSTTEYLALVRQAAEAGVRFVNEA
jgi:hypothetical protein